MQSEPVKIHQASPWSPSQALALAALVVAMLASLPLTVHPWYDQANDAALYVHTARALMNGDGYSYLGVPFVMRPPGFSLLIAPFAMHPMDFELLNWLLGLAGVLCVALLFVFYRPRLGALLAASLCLFVWLNPLFVELRTQVMSDVPGAAFIFGALLLDRWARRRPSVARDTLLALTIAAGAYVRTVCILLVPAVLLARATLCLATREPDRPRRALRTVWPVLVLPLAASLLWGVRSERADVPIPPEHVYIHSYATAMWHADPSDPGSPRLTVDELLERVPERLGEMLPLLGGGYREDSRVPEGARTPLAVLGLLCLGIVFLRRREPAELFALGSFTLLAIYFSFLPRLALPLYLLGVPAVCDTLVWIARHPGARRWVAACLSTALVVSAAVGFEPGSQHAEIEAKAKIRAELVEFVDRELPGGEPLGMLTGWHVGVETDRLVYNLNVGGRRSGTQKALEMIETYGIAAVAVNTKPVQGRRFAATLSQRFFEMGRIANWVIYRTGR